jgi:uncharacterized membrane protein
MTEIARLNDMERHIVRRFIHRQRVARDITALPLSLGDRIADRVASFGGSWTFIGIAVAAISVWMGINIVSGKPFDPYPYILLNLVLSCLAALQAPVIMMSQNRQGAHDRLDAQHDYEVNTKAEIEIVALHAKLDEIRDEKWAQLVAMQEQQLTLLARIIARAS